MLYFIKERINFMDEHYVEEGLYSHVYRFDPEAWTISSSIPIEPVTVNFPAQASVNTVSVDPIERRWIDNVMSAYNDTAGHWVYDPAPIAGSHLVHSNNGISWTAQPLIWPEDEKDDLVEDVDLSMFI